MKPAVTMTTAEVKKNLGKDMEPGRYCILDVMCEPSGMPAEPSARKKRARA